MGDKEPRPQPTPEEFEEFVAAALKVDPEGLSGKHRRGKKNGADAEQPDREGRAAPIDHGL